MLVEIQMFIFHVLIYSYFFYHDCIFINFYSNAAHKFPVYGTIKFYRIVLYCIRPTLWGGGMPTRFKFTKTGTKPCTHLGKPVGHCSVTKY